MADELSDVEFRPPKVNFVANVSAGVINDPAELRRSLVDQVTHPVRWRESVEMMIGNGVNETWEIGAGKALSGMVRRIDRSILLRGVGTPEEVRAAVENLTGN